MKAALGKYLIAITVIILIIILFLLSAYIFTLNKSVTAFGDNASEKYLNRFVILTNKALPPLIKSQARWQLSPLYHASANTGLEFINNKDVTTCDENFSMLSEYSEITPHVARGDLMGYVENEDRNSYYVYVGSPQKYFVFAINLNPEGVEGYWSNDKLKGSGHTICGGKHPGHTTTLVGPGKIGFLSKIAQIENEIGLFAKNNQKYIVHGTIRFPTRQIGKTVDNYVFDDNYWPVAYQIFVLNKP